MRCYCCDSSGQTRLHKGEYLCTPCRQAVKGNLYDLEEASPTALTWNVEEVLRMPLGAAGVGEPKEESKEGKRDGLGET